MPDPSTGAPKRPREHVFQPPRGTRDFYPADMLRRRWIEEQWRRTAIRHGFEEIDGPRFEHADLYTVKSGEGILSELFSFTRTGGETRYALRPEFTPTLARMVAARAKSLPTPTKWFSVGPYFRAERPQRGRLREFLQWNVDIVGDDSPASDAQLVACCVALLDAAGLTPRDVRIRLSDRRAISARLRERAGVREDRIDAALALLDRRAKVSDDEFDRVSRDAGFDGPALREVMGSHHRAPAVESDLLDSAFVSAIESSGLSAWCEADAGVVRGLAYYTGMVFEVHEATGAERAIAGGGRYDNLVELFGGPPTPAVGFAMGDVVLDNVLQDKGLMPTDAALRDSLGLRPDVFVISTSADESEAALTGVVSTLRRANLHTRHTYKSTRNLGKLLKEAASVGARFALILDSAEAGTLKNLDTGEQEEGVAIAGVAGRVKAAARAPDPS